MSKPTPKITPLGLRSQQPNYYYNQQGFAGNRGADSGEGQKASREEVHRGVTSVPANPQQTGYNQDLMAYRKSESSAAGREGSEYWRGDANSQYSALPRVNVERVGLRNAGNSCFMNSVLQCLVTCTDFSDSFLQWDYLRLELNSASRHRGRLAMEFARVVGDLKGGRGPVDTYALRGEVRAFAPAFAGDTQQDAHEFLRLLLASLSEEFNRVRGTPAPSHPPTANSPSDLAAYWFDYFHSRENSIVTDVFRGQFLTTAQCGVCGLEVSACETFLDLSLPITNARSVEDCLEMFTRRTDAHDFVCEKCGRSDRSTVQTRIWRLPQVLVLHLKRFMAAAGGSQKINSDVAFPDTLNMNRYCQGPLYALRAVVHHTGDVSAGHYSAYGLYRNCWDSGQWKTFNDSRVSVGLLPQRSAYILFYARLR